MEIQREAYLNQLIERRDNGMIKIVTGIRRCGKSYLLFTIFKRYLLESGVPEDHIIEIALDGIETHDCFTATEYMAIDHFGITPPGQSWQAIESGLIDFEGRLPINPSGGLIGAGHPVGATGVRMVLDAAQQVSGRAGATQVEGAKRFGTLNIGGSATTVVSFVLEGSGSAG